MKKENELSSLDDTLFIANNTLLNYCLWDDDELLIESFFTNLKIDLKFNIDHFHFCITGVSKNSDNKICKKVLSEAIKGNQIFYQLFYNEMLKYGYQGICFLVKLDNSKRIAIIFSESEDIKCTPLELVCQFNEIYKNNPHFKAKFTTSAVFNYSGYEAIHLAYIDAMELNILQFFELPNKVITNEVVNNIRFDCGMFCLDENCRKLRALSCYGNREETLALVDYLLLSLVGNSYKYDYYVATFTLIEMTFNLFQSVYKLEKSNKKYTDFKSLNDYYTYVKQMVNLIFDKCLNRYSPNILLTIAFIIENYTTDITLKDISEYINVNPTSLSSQFNDEVGTSIPQYINELKIKKAQNYLISTDLPIEKIAQNVGFDNAKYFYDVFKKVCNSTPSKYRKENNHN